MLTGATPFAGRPPQAIMAAQITERPAHIDTRRPGLSPALSSVVMRCLEKEVKDRPASAAMLVDAFEDPAIVSGSFTPLPDEQLSGSSPAPSVTGSHGGAAAGRSRRAWIVATAALALIVAAFGFWQWKGTGAQATTASATVVASAAPSVAVMPFVYLAADSSQAWTAKAVADAITNGLSKVAGLRVASQSAALSVQRRLADGDTADMPVRTFVEGVLENEGGRLRLSVRLVDASDKFTIFADRFEGEVGNLFTMEDQVAVAIGEMLREHFALPVPGRDSAAKTH
jgi:TolB-like protein